MFTFICILIAAVLAAFSIKEFRFVAIIVALEFFAHKIVYAGLFEQMQILVHWQVFLSYGLIQFLAIYILAKTNCHFVIMGLMSINMVINFYAAYTAHKALNSIVYWEKFMQIDAIYVAFVGTIMVFELLYLGWLNSYVSKCMRGADESDFNFADRLFRVSCPNLPGGKVA